MLSPRAIRSLPVLAALFLLPAALCAQPEGVVSSVRTEGIIITALAQPGHFIFQNGLREEHFDGTKETIEAQGGPDVGEPIAGLHYMHEHYVVNGSSWSAEDAKLLGAQFHAGRTGDFYLFKTIEGQLFYLPKEGETPVIRMDYVLKTGHTVTIWSRK